MYFNLRLPCILRFVKEFQNEFLIMNFLYIILVLCTQKEITFIVSFWVYNHAEQAENMPDHGEKKSVTFKMLAQCELRHRQTYFSERNTLPTHVLESLALIL